ncbi:MAG: hypothetical protein JST67_05380 [Bacteroidetes bacterium]|nr:hypothetical protein [Bacteroidota bacterium]
MNGYLFSFSFWKRVGESYYFRVIKNSFLFFCVALCCIWNISTVKNSGIGVSQSVAPFVYALRLDQSWGMFAPTVLKEDGWLVMEGTTFDKKKIDINREGAAVNYSKPHCVLDYIKSDRQRKYQENLLFECNRFIRPFYCTYLLNAWNEQHPNKKISSLQLVYMKEVTMPPFQKPKISKESVCACSK